MADTTEAQERALRELVAPAGNELCRRDLQYHMGPGRVVTVVAWVTTEDGRGAGEFRISPEGHTEGHFESTHEPPRIVGARRPGAR